MAGCDVLAVDRRKLPGFPVQCAEFVPVMLAQELDGLGAVTRQRIGSMITVIESRAPDLKDDFPGLIIDRAAFDATLVARAQSAGAECRFRTEVSAIDEQGAVTLSSGDRVNPRLIIGADGPRSVVGKAIGQPNTELVETRQVTVPLLKQHEATDIFLGADIPGGYAWLFPKGAFANLGIGTAPFAKARLKPVLEGLHRWLRDEGRVGTSVLGYTGGAIPVGGMRQAVRFLGHVPTLLAGDAAGLTNPVTGAGIVSAVVSGRLAGESAAQWAAGKSDALTDYFEELDDLFSTALNRALRRRNELLRYYENGAKPSPAALQRGWVSYPEYWAA